MKIVWIDLNCSYAHSSLALPALHAQMAGETDLEWHRVSATTAENAGMVVEALYRLQPDVVCGTLWLFNHEAMLHLLARLKALLPQVTVALGGPEFLGDNEAFLRVHPYVDVVFRGEGEEAFPQWIHALKLSQQTFVQTLSQAFAQIQGLCYLDGQQVYHDGGKAIVQHFDRLRAPEESSFYNWSKPFVQLETTRGCFNTCAFCVSGGEKPVRSLSMEQIAGRLALISSHGIRDVRMLDRTFNYNTRRALELFHLFRQYPHMRFHLEMHPALLTDELKAALADMPKGLLHLEAGIQSLRQDVLTTARRAGRLEDALSGLQFLCSLHNMETHADLIAGLPLYRLEDIYADIRTLAAYRAGEIQLESLKLLPGTEMRRRADELGIRFSPLPPYEVLATPAISPTELQTARLLSRLLDAFYNAPAWQALTRQLILLDADFLPCFLEHLIALGVADQPMALERRGLILYDYCVEHYPQLVPEATVAWVEAGMSLKKRPAERVQTKRVVPPVGQWQVVKGAYQPTYRMAYLPAETNNAPTDEGRGIWWGYDAQSQNPIPVLKAILR